MAIQVGEVWNRIVNEVATLSPDVRASCNSPANPEDIRALEHRIGVELPDEFRQYLAVMNGQNISGREHPFIGSNTLLPVTRITQLMDTMEALFAGERRLEHVVENKVQSVLWDVRWVPFSDFEANPRLILDLDPGRNGTYGQVWQWYPGVDLEGDGLAIAPTFAEFSMELSRRLTARSIEVDDRGRIQFPSNRQAGDYWLV